PPPPPPPPPPPTSGGGQIPPTETPIDFGNTAAVNNPDVFEAPVEIVAVATTGGAEQQADAQFGADFPGLVEAPLLSEDPLLEDPVSSGGDSSLYAGDESEDEEEEEEESDGSPDPNAGSTTQVEE
ncbi:MAG: hypothetical protein AAFY47_12860, partial [Pseudomonadota bacterium]